MIFPSRKFLFCLLLLPLASSAQETTKPTETTTPTPAKLDLAQFPGAIVEKVVVPVPAEIFAVLDKLDEPDWSSQIQLPESAPTSNDRTRLALMFGSTVAEGFIAVQAEDSLKVKEIGQRVRRLAGSLGLQEAVQLRANSILDAADDEDWRTVREELDKTQQTVRTEMEQLRDDDLATLVSLGGWLRGTLALTTLISEAYSTDKAELLNQPDLIKHFHESVEKMDEPIRKQTDVSKISTGLETILKALNEATGGDNETGEIPAGTVLRVGDTCSDLLDRYYFENSGN